MNDKIFRIIIICIGVFWIGFVAHIVFNSLSDNNSQEAVGIPITIATSSKEFTISIPEYNKKLDYLWSKLSEKEKCRFESENGLFEATLTIADSGGLHYSNRDMEACKKWLEKTESKYLIQ